MSEGTNPVTDIHHYNQQKPESIGMNPRTSSGLKERRKYRGIKPGLRVRRPRVAEALAEAQALRKGGLKHFILSTITVFYRKF